MAAKSKSHRCHHATTVAVADSVRCYSHPVARDENPSAHGWTCWIEECQDCGQIRQVNGNQGHREHGDFGPPTAEIAAARRARLDAASLAEIAARRDRDSRALEDAGIVRVETGNMLIGRDREDVAVLFFLDDTTAYVPVYQLSIPTAGQSAREKSLLAAISRRLGRGGYWTSIGW